MSKENIVFKDSRQKETVDKHGFIIRKSKKSQNFGKESHIKLIENKKGTRNLANNLELSAEDKKLAQEIKNKLRKTTQTIVEIGEDLTNAIKKKKRGFKEIFYEEIGISSRSAQRYMKIANHPLVIKLKEENQLEGKTMTDLEKLISSSKYKKEKSNLDIKKVAKSLFIRYKNNPKELQDIINELQTLINQSNI